jgi:hypothetical protein
MGRSLADRLAIDFAAWLNNVFCAHDSSGFPRQRDVHCDALDAFVTLLQLRSQCSVIHCEGAGFQCCGRAKLDCADVGLAQR